jgi:DNA modification methylase
MKTNPADKVQQWAIERLTPYARNARTHSDAQVAQLAASIREWGWTTPILVSPDGGVIAGHGRLLAARQLGMVNVPVIVAEGWSEPKTRAYVLADNQLALQAGWDNELLALELGELGELGFDLDLTGFGEDEIAALTPGGTEGLTDPDEVPEPPAEPITKAGDLWLLGDHRLLCGDSTKAEDVARLMGGEKADLCFTSPPYNAGNSKTGAYDGMKRTDFKKMYVHDLDRMTSDEYKAFLLSVLDRVTEIATESACVLWNVAYNANSRREYGEVAFGHSALKVQETIVWDKSHGMNVAGNHVYSRSAEFVFLLAKTEKYCSNQNGGVYWNVWRISTRDGDNMHNGHGASFPVALPSQGITQHSCEGDTVYEPFCGSGTTLIAAEQLGRKCYGMEISPAYCDVIVKRWEQFTGKQATRESARVP